MQASKVEVTSCGQSLDDVNIRKGIFQGDSLSPLPVVLCLIPLTLVLRKAKACYERGNRQFRVNHLLFMPDLKLFGKNYNQIDSLVQTIHFVNSDIIMEFEIINCGLLILRREKVVEVNFNGIVLPDGQIMKVIDNE